LKQALVLSLRLKTLRLTDTGLCSFPSQSERRKNTPKPLVGHFKKANTSPKKSIVEFRDFRAEYDGMVELGKEIKVQDVFKEGDFLDAVGTSKGKGFQGVVKRYGFSRSGWSTHGQHNR
jgi:large subunit ribosomal protein L3